MSDSPSLPTDSGTPTARKNWFARHKVLTVLGAVLGIALIAGAVNAGGGSAKDDATPPSSAISPAVVPTSTPADGEGSAEEEPAEGATGEPGFGAAVTSGNLSFTAHSMSEAGATVGSEYLSATAQGRFLRLNLQVLNVGDEPETFFVNHLTLIDAEGRRYDADSSATIYASPDAQTWISQINPGNAVVGDVIFDLPAEAAPVSLEVQGGFLAKKMTIQLQ